MNEKIREFAYQTCSDSGIADSNNPEYFVFNNSNLKKFTELIVRECWTSISPFIEDDKLAEDALAEVKEHFGVE